MKLYSRLNVLPSPTRYQNLRRTRDARWECADELESVAVLLSSCPAMQAWPAWREPDRLSRSLSSSLPRQSHSCACQGTRHAPQRLLSRQAQQASDPRYLSSSACGSGDCAMEVCWLAAGRRARHGRRQVGQRDGMEQRRGVVARSGAAPPRVVGCVYLAVRLRGPPRPVRRQPATRSMEPDEQASTNLP